MSPRIASYREFWPHYLRAHRSAASRKLSFAGSTGLLIAIAGSTALNPVSFPLAIAGSGALLWHGAVRAEPEAAAVRHLLGALALPTVASPVLFPLGVTFAWGCEWMGQLVFERKVPTPLRYPLWSLLSELRLYGHMLRGEMWEGELTEER